MWRSFYHTLMDILNWTFTEEVMAGTGVYVSSLSLSVSSDLSLLQYLLLLEVPVYLSSFFLHEETNYESISSSP